MNEINPCEDCSKTACSVCEPTRVIAYSDDSVEFDWSLRIYEVEENGKRLFEFFIEKDTEIISSGHATGFFSLVDQALEAVISNGLVARIGESASLTDLAFETGRLVERKRLQKEIDDAIAAIEQGEKILELTKEQINDLIYGDPETFEERLKEASND